MDTTDSKVRLFLELSHPHPIEILSYTPLYPYKKWNPEKMYNKPKSQYYYAFINDRDFIRRKRAELMGEEDDNDSLKNDKKHFSFEFNGYNIEEFPENENASKSNINPSNPQTQENNENIDNTNQIYNMEEERYVIFCRFHLKDFGFIHDYNKLKKEDIIRLRKTPIVYALKGRIQSLMDYREKELESKKGEGEVPNMHSNINASEEDKSNQMNDMQTMGHKKDIDDKSKLIKSNIGIDGHWFLVNNSEKVEFLSLIKYKEVIINSNELLDKANDEHSNTSNIQGAPNKISSVSTNTFNNKNLDSMNTASKDKYLQPFQFSYFIKEAKKFVTVYQNKSCKLHHNKNEFICKTCNEFCCPECFEGEARYNIHFGHKITLLDEAIIKFEEDAKFLDERIQYLRTIIENEISEKKNEISIIKNKNMQIVNQINDENARIRNEIKKEEINRAKVLAFLGNEALRIINDYNLKIKYLRLLNEKGDMNNYLINYFFFEKFYKKEIRKNLFILERKIILTSQKFKANNEKLTLVMEDLKKTF